MSLTDYLPASSGLLPKWLLFVGATFCLACLRTSPRLTPAVHQISLVSIGNSIQTYVSLAGTQQVYSGTQASIPKGTPPRTVPSTSPVTPLQARTFGVWTALSCVIRLYAAYHVHERAVYQLAMWTFGLAFAHFGSEWLWFGTARFGKGLAGPLVVSTVSGLWMWTQYGFYIG